MSFVTGHNGVRLHVTTAGSPANPALLLIHGWSQHSLSWKHQLADLSDRFYLVAPDLRGHGASDKPDAADAYDNSAPWAGDIAAILSQMNLTNPILVGWSMGGWIAQDYIRVFGDGALGGLVLVGTSVTTGRHSPDGIAEKRDPDVIARDMLGTDQPANIAATLKFLRACTATPLAAEDFATMVGFNMLVPPHVRAACRKRHEDYRPTMAKLNAPALVIWGNRERLALPPMIDETLATIPGAQALELDGLGHAPFFEDPERFNQGLAEFAEHHRRDTDAMPTQNRQVI